MKCVYVHYTGNVEEGSCVKCGDEYLLCCSDCCFVEICGKLNNFNFWDGHYQSC